MQQKVTEPIQFFIRFLIILQIKNLLKIFPTSFLFLDCYQSLQAILSYQFFQERSLIYLNYIGIQSLIQSIKIYYQVSYQMQSTQNSGKRIQNYVFSFSDCIGKGNFSTVYKAYHEITNEVFAIKIIELSSLKSKKLEELLFSEIEVLKKLNHPNVLKCYEVFTSNRHCYIITELCNQGDLETKLRRQHTFSQAEAQTIIRDVFLGLLYLSSIKIVHRDLKVANIFLHNKHAKIADFGFAKFTEQKWKDINIGSPIYMSPEGFIDNIYGPKTDVWAFGVFLYELFHGQTPFSRCKNQIELKNNIIIPLTWNRLRQDLSPNIKQIILRCMEVNEEKRCGFYQLKYTPYFRKLLQGKMPRQTKFTNHNQPQLTRTDILVTPQTLRNTYLSPIYRSQSPDRIITSPKLHLSNNTTQKSINNEQKSNIQNNSVNKTNQISVLRSTYRKDLGFVNILISSPISFKGCVNFLHYCRLIYKFIMNCFFQNSDDRFVKMMKGYLLNCLAQILDRIQSKAIYYEGQNVMIREKKLREVTEQYTRKYKKQFGNVQLSADLSLSSIRQLCHNNYLDVDAKIREEGAHSNFILEGHCIMVIWHATRLLQQCYQMRRYQNFQTYKQIQILLNKAKNGVDYDSYIAYKERIDN